MAKKRSATPRTAASTAQARMLEAVHKVWLAGLGAAVRAQRGAPQLLDELIAEGAQAQASARGSAEKALRRMLGEVRTRVDEQVGQARGQAASTLENLEKIFQTRVHRALTQLGVPSAEDVHELSRRVDALNANISKLARGRGAPARSRSAPARSRSAPARRRGRTRATGRSMPASMASP